MKVSVIIPCYNAEAYIRRCLNALELQQYKDFEVICIDDCSTDDTANIINDFIDRGKISLRYFRNSVNSGPALSRNHGIESAIGEYICFCDSDDWYTDDYLSKMVDKAEENDADMVFCGYQLIVNTTGRMIKHPLAIDNETLLDKRKLLITPIDALWSLMVRKSIIAEVPQPNIRTAEDMAIIPILMVRSNRFGCVSECIYNYWSHAESASMIKKDKPSKDGLVSIKHIMDNVGEEYRQEVAFIGARNYVYGALLNRFRYKTNIGEAKDILNGFEALFPNWYNNEYIKTLPLFKRLFLLFAHKRQYGLLRVMSCFHTLIVT